MNDPETAAFGHQCLLARRLIEKGVRFVQIFSGGWDSHDYLERDTCFHAGRYKQLSQFGGKLINEPLA